MMDKRNKRRYFETLRKSLKDGARTAVMNASSESQIDRIQRLYQSKDEAINPFAVCKPAKPAPTIIIFFKSYLSIKNIL